MGLFDSLAKLGKELENNEVVKNFKEELKDVVENATELERKGMEIPEEYNEFPKFEGNMTNLNKKDTSNYERCTMDYSNVTLEGLNNYTDLITGAGYTKKTNVRYEKGNSYIIVEPKGNNLHLVYHIKK